MSSTYINPSASTYTYPDPPDLSLVQQFHQSLPSFATTPLIPLPTIASKLSLRHVFLKDESSRLSLPAFKILGASWGTHRAICHLFSLPLTSSLSTISTTAQKHSITLFAATEGNHGRAVARVAKLLSLPCHIYVPGHTSPPVIQNIASEGAQIHQLSASQDYDDAVAAAHTAATTSSGGLLIQDNAFDSYTDIPTYIVEGYSTLLTEIAQCLASQSLRPTHVITPIGVGSLGHAVTAFCKSSTPSIKVIAVEPETAACLNENLRAGRHRSIGETGNTIMDGMNCATISPISWPTLRNGVDVSVTVTDSQSHEAIEELQGLGVEVGPCGAGTLAALKKLVGEEGRGEEVGLGEESVVVLLGTEGKRWYEVPKQD